MFGSVAARLAAVMAAAELGHDPDDLLASAERMGIDFDMFGAPRSNREIIQLHNAALRDSLRRLNSADSGLLLHTSFCGDTKPADEFPQPPPFAALMPISCADLQPGTTHRGRVLKGRLVVDALLMTGIHSVLEDEAGDVVKVTFYNTPELHQSRHSSNFRHSFRLARQLFPKGQAVAIIEPFFKLAADGSFILRIDNPAEVLFLDSLHDSPEALQQQGDKHLSHHQYKEATACYTQVLSSMLQQQASTATPASGGGSSQQPQQAQLLLSVLLNLSATHLQLQQPLKALLYAAAAAALSSHSNSKAYYRAAMALDRLLAERESGGVSSSSSSSRRSTDNKRIAAAATELMECSAKLAGQTTAAAKAQLMAALTHVTAAANGSTTKSSKRQQPAEEWLVVCKLLSEGASKLDSCFAGSSSSGSSSAVSAGVSKEAGNAAFKQGDHTAALQHYLTAFSALQQSSTQHSIAKVLASRAKSWLAQPSQHSQQQACLDALSAALLNPAVCSGGFYTAATALLQLDEMPGAAAVCGLGMQLLPDYLELQELQQRIQTASAAAAAAAAAASDRSQRQASSSQSSADAGSSSSSSSGGRGAQQQPQQKGKKGRKGGRGAGSSSSNRPSGMTEREMKEFTNEGCMGVEQMAMFNQVAAMAARMAARGGGGRGAGGSRGGGGGGRGRGRGRGGDLGGAIADMIMLDERMPKLHEEFSKGGRWPPQVDIEWANRQLWNGYELGRALPMHIIGLLKQETVGPQLLLPRLGMLSRERIDWLLDAEMGNVSFPSDYPPYGGGWQSFVNAPAHTEVLTPGTTHVAIGFVDLGGLAAACELMADQHPHMARAAEAAVSGASSSSSSSSSSVGGGGSSSSSSVKPLSWVGYEMAAPCVAKTLVLLQMVKQGAAVDEILQVWYSAVWSNSTLSAFRRAVTELLTTAAAVSAAPPSQRRSLHASADALTTPDVLELLRFWQVKHVPLASARKGWQDNAEHSTTFIGNFKRKSDRLALCELALTGELRALGPGDVGSLCMFAVPAKFEERAFDECFLQCLPFRTLMEAWRAQPTSDIVAVGVGLLRRRTKLLVGMLRAGLVQAEVHLGAVHIDAPRTIAAIRALEPYTISWSNMPDYMAPQDFHRLARAISAPADTVHFMHSMNWVKHVKGAFHLDWTLCCKEEALPKIIPDFKKTSEAGIKMYYTLCGVENLLLSPPIDNVRNVVDYALFTLHNKAYVKAFFARGLSGMRAPDRSVVIVEPPEYSILARTNSTMHITFTYDDDIRFQGMVGRF